MRFHFEFTMREDEGEVEAEVEENLRRLPVCYKLSPNLRQTTIHKQMQCQK